MGECGMFESQFSSTRCPVFVTQSSGGIRAWTDYLEPRMRIELRGCRGGGPIDISCAMVDTGAGFSLLKAYCPRVYLKAVQNQMACGKELWRKSCEALGSRFSQFVGWVPVRTVAETLYKVPLATMPCAAVFQNASTKSKNSVFLGDILTGLLLLPHPKEATEADRGKFQPFEILVSLGSLLLGTQVAFCACGPNLTGPSPFKSVTFHSHQPQGQRAATMALSKY